MYIADLHIHSRYSRATSRDLIPEKLELAARQKGIGLLGTGDFTHPAWRRELYEKLIPAQDGFYKLKKEYIIENDSKQSEQETEFVVSGEISSIYKQDGKVRKVHSLIILPSLEDADRLSAKLEVIGNIHSDGRPILGLSCHDLLEIMLEVCPEGMLIPAHIWTPHFSMLGARSGFDSVEQCFGELTSYIHAVETGLSSDPPMNWQLSALDRFQLISNSDAHSPGKLGREANLIGGGFSYKGLKTALETGQGLEGTIEFFPEEGKYHFDGHRKCHICLDPGEAEKFGDICPICGKTLTMGVSHRILQLADRPVGFIPENPKPFESLVPLAEVIAASTGRSAASKRVQAEYFRMLEMLGSEFFILRELPIEDIERNTGDSRVAEGIRRLRNGQVTRHPGFDGEYGSIRLFDPDEITCTEGQISFGDLCKNEEKTQYEGKKPVAKAYSENPVRAYSDSEAACSIKDFPQNAEHFILSLNREQREAAEKAARSIAVIAGPGTGKTGTLTARIQYLIERRRVKPSEITAVTFTKQAAEEMRTRLKKELTSVRSAGFVHIGTFHALCMELLQKSGETVVIAEGMQQQEIAETVIEECNINMSVADFLDAVSEKKRTEALEFHSSREATGKEMEISHSSRLIREACSQYEQTMMRLGLWDFDDLIIKALYMLSDEDKRAVAFCRHFRYLLIDEFQDIDPLQYQLILKWNRHGNELFVIGDPDQSIYGFRGADPDCFKRLSEDFPNTLFIRLKDNYRSTRQILAASCKLISNNPGGDRKLASVRGDGLPVRIARAEGLRSEGIFIAREITRMIGGIDMLDAEKHQGSGRAEGSRSFSDIAVLCRTNRQTEAMEEYLKTEGIPYVVRGRGSFLEADSVKETLGFFRKLYKPANPKDQEGAAKTEESRMLTERYAPLMKKRPAEVLKAWLDDKDLWNDENMQKLYGTVIFHKDMGEFLKALDFGEEADLQRCSTREYRADAVSLMTLHASKGLEFPAVIIPGLRRYSIPLEERKPHINKQGTADERDVRQTEEERRLLYVGMTRAREELIVVTSGEPSIFLSEIPAGLALREKTFFSGTLQGRQLDMFKLLDIDAGQ